MHDGATEPPLARLGRGMTLTDTPEGLALEAQLAETTRGDDALALIAAGVVTALSAEVSITERDRTTKPPTVTRATLTAGALVPAGAFTDASLFARQAAAAPPAPGSASRRRSADGPPGSSPGAGGADGLRRRPDPRTPAATCRRGSSERCSGHSTATTAPASKTPNGAAPSCSPPRTTRGPAPLRSSQRPNRPRRRCGGSSPSPAAKRSPAARPRS